MLQSITRFNNVMVCKVLEVRICICLVNYIKIVLGVIVEKRKVRIPALEAAEANKRLEEKKRNERELQKAAMKAEREKRQREERDKKEKDKDKDKEKKRKCTEIDRQTQREEQTKKEPPRRARVVREEKEVQCNVIVSLHLLLCNFLCACLCLLVYDERPFAAPFLVVCNREMPIHGNICIAC